MDDGSSCETERGENTDPFTPKYDGEDTRLTSSKELAGWYSYGFAAEVFAVCAMGKLASVDCHSSPWTGLALAAGQCLPVSKIPA